MVLIEVSSDSKPPLYLYPKSIPKDNWLFSETFVKYSTPVLRSVATDLKTGVEYLTNVSENNQLSLGIDLGYRYKGGLESDETSINTTSASTLGSANDNIDGQHNFSISGSLKLSF